MFKMAARSDRTGYSGYHKTVFLLPTDATPHKAATAGSVRGDRSMASMEVYGLGYGLTPLDQRFHQLMLSNVRPLENNLDLIQLNQSTQYETREYVVCFVFTEQHG